MIALFAASTLYEVKLDIPYLIPLLYFIAFVVCTFIRELTKGWLKYVLVILFLASLAIVVYVLLAENKPWCYIVPAITVFAGASGLWGWLRDILAEFKKI